MKHLFLEMGFENKSDADCFNNITISLSILYSKFIKNIRIDNLNKIAIRIVDDPDQSYIFEPNSITKVCALFRYCDLSEIRKVQDLKTVYLFFLNLIQDSVLELADKYHWPVNGFKEAYNKVIEADFINEFIIIPAKKSKNRKNSISVMGLGSKDYISISLIVKSDQNQNEEKTEILRTVFFMDDLRDIIFSLKWIDNETALISNKDGEINFRFSIIDKSIKLILTPHKHDSAFLKNMLKTFLV